MKNEKLKNQNLPVFVNNQKMKNWSVLKNQKMKNWKNEKNNYWFTSEFGRIALFFFFSFFVFFDLFIFSFFVIFDFSFLMFETYSRIVITAQKSKIKKWKNEKYQRMKKWKTDFKNQKWKNEKQRYPLFLPEPLWTLRKQVLRSKLACFSTPLKCLCPICVIFNF